MGSSCAWHQNGLHVALTFTSGDIAVVVSHLTLPAEALKHLFMPDIGMVQDCLKFVATLHLSLCSHQGFSCLQDIRTWSVVWEVKQSCPVFGCCYLPGSANALAVCGPPSSISIFDTSGDSSGGRQQHQPLHVLHESPSSAERHLLCVAAAPDNSAIAASGTEICPLAPQDSAPDLDDHIPCAPQGYCNFI